jgi:hypothetical protein
MNARTFSRPAISTVAILLGFTTFAQAGPPLICHPIEIGQGKSLPWVDGEALSTLASFFDGGKTSQEENGPLGT